MKKWKLSKEQAIEEHRKMWGWVYDTVKNRIETGNYKKDGMLKYEDIDAFLLKGEYISKFYPDYKPLQNNCFLCEYVNCNKYLNCGSCPLKWEKGNCIIPDSEYKVVSDITMEISRTGNIPEDYLEAIRKVRDLPVKE